MSQRKPHIIVPAEIKVREFDAKLLFSCVAAERGFPAITGCHNQITRRMHALPRGVFVSKSLTRKSRLVKHIARELGHHVVAWDEEGLVHMKPEFYQRYKLERTSVALIEALFAWGERNALSWTEWEGYEGTPIHVTGNPRCDLMLPQSRGIFDPDVEALRARHGRYLMVSSNFGRVNHFIPERTAMFRTDGMPDRREVPAEIFGTKQDPALAAVRLRMMRYFETMLPALARRFPDHSVILRPHPSENPASWQELAKDHSNIVVTNEGNVLPWLLGAEAVIHNGCTTGLEAFLLGRPAIAYMPFTDPDYETPLPNDVSHQAQTLEKVLELAERAISADLQPSKAHHDLLAHHIAPANGKLASDKILDILERDFGTLKPFDLMPWISGQARSRWRDLKKVYYSLDPTHHNSAIYTKHRFPDSSLAEVERRIEDFRRVLGRFEKVRVRQRGPNMFELLPG